MYSLNRSANIVKATLPSKNESRSPSLFEELLRVPANSASLGAQFNYAGRITQLSYEEGIESGRLNPKLALLLERIDGSDILDLGCGRNCPAQSLFNRYAPHSKILSVDLDENNFQKYEGNTQNRIFIQDDAQSLTLIPDSSVAVVFENLLFNDNHINGLQVMTQVCRVLKEGGVFISGALLFQIKKDAVLQTGDTIFGDRHNQTSPLK